MMSPTNTYLVKLTKETSRKSEEDFFPRMKLIRPSITNCQFIALFMIDDDKYILFD